MNYVFVSKPGWQRIQVAEEVTTAALEISTIGAATQQKVRFSIVC